MYSGFAQLISFEIDCFYGALTRIYEYEPLNYRSSYGPGICRDSTQLFRM